MRGHKPTHTMHYYSIALLAIQSVLIIISVHIYFANNYAWTNACA